MVNTKKLEEELNNLPEGWIVLVETSAEKIMDIGLSVIKILTDKSYKGIILSTSRPYSNLLSLYKKSNINIKKLLILDCICKSQGAKQEKIDNVIYIDHVTDLTNISLSINECMKIMKGNKFIFIDTITTMLIHNQPNLLAVFIHSILTKMRLNKTCGMLISLENETNKEIRAEIAQLCDKVIKL